MRKQKNKLYLNIDSLKLEQESSWFARNKLIIYLLFPLVAICSAVGSRIILNYSTTPKEVILMHENRNLHHKYNELNTHLDKIFSKLDTINAKDDSIYRAVFGLKPISNSLRTAGTGGLLTKHNYNELNTKQIVQITSNRIKDLENKISITKDSYNDVLAFARKNEHKLRHIPAIMPVSNKTLKRTGSGFGMRKHPILNITRMHEGQDFIAEKGTPIYATADGKVKKKYVSKTFGNVLIIDHGYGFETYYAHLDKYNIEQNDKVSRGDLIGFMGTTGLSSGTHLHYEVHLNGKEVNPINYFYNDLSAEQYKQILEIANSFENSMD